MKKLLLITMALIGLLASCQQEQESDNGQKTVIVFDNTQGICAATVYNDVRRRDEDKIAEVPAGKSSQEIEWTPSTAPEIFYFKYHVGFKGIDGFLLDYVPELGRDQTKVPITAGTKTSIIIPRLDETVSSRDTLLSNNCYIFIRNNSSFPFELHVGSSPKSPDGSPNSPTIYNGQGAQYTITPGSSSSYQLLAGADYKALSDYIANFEAGYVYSFVFDGDVRFIREVNMKFENAAMQGTEASGLYHGVKRIGSQNLASSLSYISANAEEGDDFYIVLGTSETIPPMNIDYSGKTVEITLSGYGEGIRINLNASGAMFTIGSGVTLVLENITLQGRSNNNVALVIVESGGTLEMKTSSKVSGNTNTATYNTFSGTAFSRGGGVYVGSNGTFIMSGGEISGNKVSASGRASTTTSNITNPSSYNTYSDGGGVYVDSNGTFTMSGGEISGNTASASVYHSGDISYGAAIVGSPISDGGGVFVGNGTFTMSGGEISGNTASASLSIGSSVSVNRIVGSSISDGGGVFVGRNGTFTMSGGEISGNTASASLSIGSSKYYTGGSGGGVYNDGTFRIVTGTVSGIRSDGYESALYNNWTAQMGTFSGEIWNSNGELSTAEYTINVKNGELVQ